MPTPASIIVTSSRVSRRGSALVLVLVILLFTAMAITLFVERAGIELLAEAKQADRERLRPEAYSALEVTLATLADFRTIDGALYSPAQGWADPLAYAGYTPTPGRTVQVSFEDESGKVSLPRLSSDQLLALFQHFGLHENEARRATDALFTWMKPDYAPSRLEIDPKVYERAHPSHQPPRRSLRSFDELASIAVARDYFYDEHGQPTQLWRDFSQNVSLYSFTPSNINGAGAAALAASQLDPQLAARLAQHLTDASSSSRSQPNYFRTLDDAQTVLGVPLSGQALGTTIKALRILISVREGPSRFQLEAVVTSGEATFPPPSVVSDVQKTTNATAPAAPPPIPPKKLDYPFTLLAISERTGDQASPVTAP